MDSEMKDASSDSSGGSEEDSDSSMLNGSESVNIGAEELDSDEIDEEDYEDEFEH